MLNRKEASREIADLLMRIVSKYNALEKIPVRHGTKHKLYHSERHLIDKIGENPEMNVTEFAKAAGVTKGAISQVLSKLEKKGVARRSRKEGNDKEVLIELTKSGREAYERHREINEESIAPLVNELKRYPNDKIQFLIQMFRWIDGFLDLSQKKMEGHRTHRH
jgi:DNA-binding MarR family transcriptional regulator